MLRLFQGSSFGKRKHSFHIEKPPQLCLCQLETLIPRVFSLVRHQR